MTIRIVPLTEEPEALLSPDIVWDGEMGDFAAAGPDETKNRGGLRARAQLATAILMLLQTDRRADPSELRDGDDNRGWAGDGFDLDADNSERPLGSKLWLLRRRSVDEVETPRLAEDYAREALDVLIEQRAVARIDVQATARPADRRLDLNVALYGRDGTQLYAARYGVLWDQVTRGDIHPLAQ
ncbi:phage GP46 family protein [Afifella sp. YEN Y35]|uniref:phage GP46 family protein n=1 Tax=Afifella sp. YEN Y35 TaxID=3388337 RepID=UPI0039E03F86